MLASARALVFSIVASVLVCSGAGRAQAGPDGESAAAARFHEMSSDTSGAYAFDPRELLVLATRLLPAAGKRQEGLDLLKLLDGAYPETAELKYRLGLACVDLGEAADARRNLERTMELDSTRTHIRWMLDRLDERIETSRLGREYAETYAPGADLGIQGPYLGQPPPGDVPEVFAPGILSTHLHEYSITISPDGRYLFFSYEGDMYWISARILKELRPG
jgi:hypothetical protein